MTANSTSKSASAEKSGEAFGLELARAIKPALTRLSDRIATLEREIQALKSKGVAYKGVFQPQISYKCGDLVTHEGSMWHANTETNERPGTTSNWTLAVKRGADGK